MPDIVETLATHTGIDRTSIEKMLGSILSLLKSHLPAETFSQIESKIPGSAQMLSSAPEGSEGGGLMDIASKLAGKVFGSGAGGGVEILQHAEKLGISTASLVSIVTSLYKFLSSHLPPEVMAQIVKALPSIPGLSLVSETEAEPTATPAEGGTHSF